MDKEIQEIIEKGEKEKLGGIICLVIFLFFTFFALIITFFVHFVYPILILFVIMDLVFVLVIIDGINHIKKPHKYTFSANFPINILYESKWNFDIASKEYLELVGKDDVINLTDDDKHRILEYASMPAVYFLLWLIDNDYMSEKFYKYVNMDDINNLKMRKMSPVYFYMHSMNCILELNKISENVLSFVCDYFYSDNEKNYLRLSNTNLSDYYECIKNDKGFLFCIDFSYSIYEKICKKINNAYDAYRNKQ